jgi:hypothetical protein
MIPQLRPVSPRIVHLSSFSGVSRAYLTAYQGYRASSWELTRGGKTPSTKVSVRGPHGAYLQAFVLFTEKELATYCFKDFYSRIQTTLCSRVWQRYSS